MYHIKRQKVSNNVYYIYLYLYSMFIMFHKKYETLISLDELFI